MMLRLTGIIAFLMLISLNKGLEGDGGDNLYRRVDDLQKEE